MGTCYSTHSQSGKRTYPSDMSISSQRSGLVPMPRPAYTGHSNKMPENPGERAALAPRSHSATRLPRPDAATTSRFGFKKSGLPVGKSGLMRSSDSINSSGSELSKSSCGSQRRLNDSFEPKESKGWKMIDDSSTVDSRSHSTKSRSTNKSSHSNGNSRKSSPVKAQAIHKDNRSAVQAAGRIKGGLREPVSMSLKPADSDNWIKAGHLASAESLKENRNEINTKKKFGFFGRSKSATSQNIPKPPQQKKVDLVEKDEVRKEEESVTPTQMSREGSSEAFNKTFVLEENQGRPVEQAIVPEKEETVQTSIIVIETDLKKSRKVKKAERQNSDMEKSVETVKAVDEDRKLDKKTARKHVPLARMDSVETGSVSSLNSDDLMLDMDINLDDEMNQSMCSSMAGSIMERSMNRPRALSDALETSTLSKQDRRPNPTRPRLSDAGVPRRSLLERQASGRQLRARGYSASEAVQELGSLLGDSTATRRNPKLEQTARPASFPGPLGSNEEAVAAEGISRAEGAVRPVSLRPPRPPSLVEDEDQIAVDGHTYRHMQQDITNFKTMLLKLKRVIQQEELGSPMDPNYKNGMKYGLGSSATTPDSPLVKTEESWKTAILTVATTMAPPSGPSLVEVMQENAELRQQLQVMQKQLEDHEKTIKLLQQQMETALKSQRGITGLHSYQSRTRPRLVKTKYECGHLGPGGCVYSNAATQTDKPRLAAPSRGNSRLSAKGASGSSENIISLIKKQKSSEDIRKQVENDKSLTRAGVLQPPSVINKTKTATRNATDKPTAKKRASESWRPKTSVPYLSATVPGPSKRSVGEPLRSRRGSIDSCRSSDSQKSNRGPKEANSRRSLAGTTQSALDIQRSREKLTGSTDAGSIRQSKENLAGSMQSVEEVSRSSTDTGVAELSSPDGHQDSSSAGTAAPDTGSESTRNRSTTAPVSRSRIPSPVSRLPAPHLTRPYAASRGSRIAASFTNRPPQGSSK